MVLIRLRDGQLYDADRDLRRFNRSLRLGTCYGWASPSEVREARKARPIAPAWDAAASLGVA